MNFEPQKFFVGLLDFFTILLPGMLLVYVLQDETCPRIEAIVSCPAPGGAEAVAAFLVASYLVGHFVFLVSAWLDEIYDALRDRTMSGQIRRLERGRPVSPPWVRALVWLLFKNESNRAVERASALRKHVLSPLNAAEAINTFQWSKALLARQSPANHATVQRFEADSKFFRSLVIVSLTLAVLLALDVFPGQQFRWTAVAIAILIALIAFWRYADQRLKATNQAYWSVITLIAETAPPKLATEPRETESTHAGGIVYKCCDGKFKFLLVQASERADVWVVPKGHIEAGETASRAAIREVHEETGVWAEIRKDLGIRTLTTRKGPVTVRFYLMEYRGRGYAKDRDRAIQWLPSAAAGKTTPFNETRELLAMSERTCNEPWKAKGNL